MKPVEYLNRVVYPGGVPADVSALLVKMQDEGYHLIKEGEVPSWPEVLTLLESKGYFAFREGEVPPWMENIGCAWKDPGRSARFVEDPTESLLRSDGVYAVYRNTKEPQ